MSDLQKPELKPEYPVVIGDDAIAAVKEVGVKDSTVTPNGDEGAVLTTDERIEKLEKELEKTNEKYTNVRTAMQTERSKRHAEAVKHQQALVDLKEKQVEEKALEGLEAEEAVPVAAFKKTTEARRESMETKLLTRDLKVGQALSRSRHEDFDDVVGPQMDEIEARMSSDPVYAEKVLEGDNDPLNFVEHVYQTLKAQQEAVAKPPNPEAKKVVDKVANPVVGPKTMDLEQKPVPEKANDKADLSDLETARSLLRQGKITMDDLNSRWS